MDAGLQHAEVRAAGVHRHDLAVHDDRGADPAGEDGQLGVGGRHVVAVTGEQADLAAADVADRADPVPLELPAVGESPLTGRIALMASGWPSWARSRSCCFSMRCFE